MYPLLPAAVFSIPLGESQVLPLLLRPPCLLGSLVGSIVWLATLTVHASRASRLYNIICSAIDEQIFGVFSV